MKNKFILISIVVVSAIGVSLIVAWWVIKSKNQAGSNQPSGAVATPIETPLPNNYFLGVVTRVDKGFVYLEYNRKERKVEVSSETEIVKQVPDPVRVVRLDSVTLKDIKVGDEVVVYFSSGPPQTETFKATKLQVL